MDAPLRAKINHNLFKLKQLLGLVVYKGAPDRQNSGRRQTDDQVAAATTSMYRVEGSDVQIQAVDPREQASFD